MQSFELITIGLTILLSSTLIYKISFFHKRKIGPFSLLQVFLLVLLPGILYTIIFYHVLDILERPKNEYILFNDKILTSLLLLSILYTYGGIAIHGVCKTLSPHLHKKSKKSKACRMNDYFHQNFSHNLTFIGASASATFFSLLELNHVSPYPEQSKFLITLLTGIFLGLTSILWLYNYDGYRKRWRDAKFFFFSVWMLFVILIYATKPYIKDVQQYPITLIMLISFVFLGALSVFLGVRKVKNKIKLSLQPSNNSSE